MPAPHDRATQEPVADVEKRIRHLASTLQDNGKKIIVPTPALAEVLTRAERAGADYFTKINRSSAFKIEPFDTRAAIELARMTAAAIEVGDKRGGVAASWNKIKFDRQIVAIAKINNVSTIYSDDRDLKTFAVAQGITVVSVGELPLPPEDAQAAFAWDVLQVDEETEEEQDAR